MNGKYTDYCLSTTGGEQPIISPPQLFTGFSHASISIYFAWHDAFQGNYGHFKQNTGAKQRQVLENSLQNTTDGITAAKPTHSLKAVVVLRARASQ